MDKIIIFGTGQNADVIYYHLKKYTKYKIVSFCVEKNFLNKKKHFGLPVCVFEEIEKTYSPKIYKFIAPVSHIKNNNKSVDIYKKIKEKKFKFVNYINPLSIIDTEDIGENTIILEQNNIQPFSKIGNNCLIWSGNHIGHHSIIEDNCFVSSHVVISGAVKIKKNSYIGVNSTIRDNVTIGENSILGANSLVLKNLSDNTIMKSNQSKFISLKKKRNIKI